MKQTERCAMEIDGRPCYTPLRYDMDHLGRVFASCPACLGLVSRVRYRPATVEPVVDRRHVRRLTPEQRLAIATLANEVGDVQAARQLGTSETVAKVWRRHYFGAKPLGGTRTRGVLVRVR